MKRAALGVRMHSGWGVMVCVAEPFEVIDRRRIVVIDPATPGAKQPYHFAEQFGLPDAERHIAQCAAASFALALAALEEVKQFTEERQVRIIGAALLTSSGRALPALEKILAAHPLIHTAEGEFFRKAITLACERLKIPVTAIPERDLEPRAELTFGKAAGEMQNRVASARSALGPPWTADHKNAALAAAMILAKQ